MQGFFIDKKYEENFYLQGKDVQALNKAKLPLMGQPQQERCLEANLLFIQKQNA